MKNSDLLSLTERATCPVPTNSGRKAGRREEWAGQEKPRRNGHKAAKAHPQRPKPAGTDQHGTLFADTGHWQRQQGRTGAERDNDLICKESVLQHHGQVFLLHFTTDKITCEAEAGIAGIRPIHLLNGDLEHLNPNTTEKSLYGRDFLVMRLRGRTPWVSATSLRMIHPNPLFLAGGEGSNCEKEDEEMEGLHFQRIDKQM
jgi:hypothetical protein